MKHFDVYKYDCPCLSIGAVDDSCNAGGSICTEERCPFVFWHERMVTLPNSIIVDNPQYDCDCGTANADSSGHCVHGNKII